MPTHRCRTTRRRSTRRVPAPLWSVEAALDVVFGAADQHRAQVIALPLDDDHVGGTCLVVDDVTDPDRVIDVASLVVTAAEQLPVQALVLASVRPDAWLHEEDLERWERLRAVVEHGGVRLLDWFVIGDGLAASLRELTGGPDEWTPPGLR